MSSFVGVVFGLLCSGALFVWLLAVLGSFGFVNTGAVVLGFVFGVLGCCIPIWGVVVS